MDKARLVTKHDPDRIHWNKIFKMVRESDGSGVSLYDIANDLDVPLDSESLRETVSQLLKQGRVRKVLKLVGSIPRVALVEHVEEDTPRKRNLEDAVERPLNSRRR